MIFQTSVEHKQIKIKALMKLQTLSKISHYNILWM